jgi:glucokinase
MPTSPVYSIGIDLGGTHIKAVAITARGKVLAEVTTATEDTGKRTWAGNVRNAVRQIETKVGKGSAGIGVAAPGLPSKRGDSIAYMPGRLPGLEGLVWRRYLGSSRFVPVLNDAQAALLGEAWLGAARNAKDIVLLTLGTGVGGAAMVDGHSLRGHIGRAGHFGHLSLNPNGPPDVARCPGSLEDAIGDCTVKARSQGRFKSTLELVRASQRDDKEARLIWLTSVRALAAAVSSLINVLDPQVVVIGGGIANAGAALFRPLREFLDRFEWRPGAHKARIVRARLGDRAGAFGAAWEAMGNDRLRAPL